MLLLDHVGAKRARTTPLVYMEDGADVVIVASKGGHRRHLGLVPQPPGPPGRGGPDRAPAPPGPRSRGHPDRARASLAAGN